ncbi:MAG: DUF3786 domain-containing protein [Oscillospiraceae bacterium]|jgi:hypothetical protein|nr:DUF3786 domain-containing protein [Oscillospiraceae bacterium]
MSNYDRVYETIRAWLSECDFSEAASRLGFEPPNDGVLTFASMGRGWRVDKDGVTQISGSGTHVNFRSVIIWYLTFKGSKWTPAIREADEFAPLPSFSSGIFGQRSADFQSFEWRRHSGLTYGEFRSAAERIGAKLTRSERYGEVRRLDVFPKVPALLTYSEEDDEFPAQVDVKFRADALTFLPFETLAVLHGLIEREFSASREK